MNSLALATASSCPRLEGCHYRIRLDISPSGLRRPSQSRNARRSAAPVAARWPSGSPRLLALDEPTAELGAESRERVGTLISRAAQTAVVIITSHLTDAISGGMAVLLVEGGQLTPVAGPRGPLCEVLFFSLLDGLAGVCNGGQAGGYAGNMTDLPGFMSPISYGQGGTDNFIIGGAEIAPGSAPIHLDVMSGVLADGYLAARLTWLGIAALVPLLAGLIYAPHAAGKIFEPGQARPADPRAMPAEA